MFLLFYTKIVCFLDFFLDVLPSFHLSVFIVWYVDVLIA